MGVRGTRSAYPVPCSFRALFVLLLLLLVVGAGLVIISVMQSPPDSPRQPPPTRIAQLPTCPSPSQPTPSPDPSAPYKPPPINVSCAEYVAALSRWNSLGVEEYIVTVDVGSFAVRGAGVLKVSDYGNRVELIRTFETEGSGRSVSWPDNEPMLKLFTVEGLFARVHSHFDPSAQATATVWQRMTHIYSAQQVTFHPDLGYPTYFAYSPVSELGYGITNANGGLMVLELDIVRSAAPVP